MGWISYNLSETLINWLLRQCSTLKGKNKIDFFTQTVKVPKTVPNIFQQYEDAFSKYILENSTGAKNF